MSLKSVSSSVCLSVCRLFFCGICGIKSTFKTRGTPAKRRRNKNIDDIRKTLGELIALTQTGQHSMSTPSPTANKPSTRSSKKKQTEVPVVDLSGSPTLINRKRRKPEDPRPEEPLPKKMAEDRILDAIKVVSNSVSAMEARMKTFSTKTDINNMVDELKDVKEKVIVNSLNIEKLFEFRKNDQEVILKKVEQIIDSRVGSMENRAHHERTDALKAEHELQFLQCRRSIRMWPVSEVNDLEGSVRAFLKRYLKMPAHKAEAIDIEHVQRVVQPRRSKIQKEVLVRFRNAAARDVAQSYATTCLKLGGRLGLDWRSLTS